MRKSDLTVYFSARASNIFETLASSCSWKEKINQIPIYSDKALTKKVGFIVTTLTESNKVTIFSSNVVFTVLNGSINYNHSQLSSTNSNRVFLDTITYGNGDFSFSKGYVITIFPKTDQQDTATVKFYLTRK